MKIKVKAPRFFCQKTIFLVGLGLAVIWTISAVLVILWDIHLEKQHIRDITYEQAVANFNKDIIYRSWAAMEGGVYVPISEKTPPNPYLANLPERDITTPSGKKLTLVNPDYMTRLVHDIENNLSSTYIHVTSLHPIRPENAPDSWEHTALDSIGKGAPEVVGLVDFKGQQHLRLMRPLIIETSCLKCHTEYGYKAGDILGGISITIFMEPYNALLKDFITTEAIITGVIWLVGFLFFGGGGWYLQLRRDKDRQNVSILRRAAQTTEVLFSHPATGVAEINARTGRFVRLNGKFCEIAGMTNDQLQGSFFTEISHPEEEQENYDLFNRILKGEVFNFFIDKRMLRKDGQTKWVQVTVTPLWAPGETPTSLIIMIHDITEKRRVEQEIRDNLETAEHSRLALLSLAEDQQRSQVKLRESEERYRGLFENMSEGVAYCRMIFEDGKPVDWIYLLVNDNFEKMTGLKEVTGKLVTELIPGIREQDPELFNIYSRVALTGNPERFEIEVNALNMWFDVSVYCPERDFFVAVFDVITNRKRAEEELIRAKDKAEQSDRLKSTFLANMSHEIRTPMNAIVGFAGMLSDQNLSEEDRKRFSAIIQSRSDDLMHIINDLLEISRIESGNVSVVKEKVSLNTIIDEMKIVFRQNITRIKKSNLTLKIEKALRDNYSTIITDGFILKQVFSNLIDNAIKYTETGSIRIGYHPPAEGTITCFVSDTGIGITPENLMVIFEHFRKAEIPDPHKYGGTGLGLSICRGSLALLGGKIWVESVPGKGSTFYFTLPFEQARENRNDRNDRNGRQDHHDFNWSDKKILLVEDDPSNMEYLKIILGRTHAELVPVFNGIELKAMYDKLNLFDLVLLDVRLPDANGWELAKEIKTLQPGLPVIAQTAYAMSTDKKKSEEVGCNGYISKPIIQELLLNMISKFI